MSSPQISSLEILGTKYTLKEPFCMWSHIIRSNSSQFLVSFGPQVPKTWYKASVGAWKVCVLMWASTFAFCTHLGAHKPHQCECVSVHQGHAEMMTMKPMAKHNLKAVVFRMSYAMVNFDIFQFWIPTTTENWTNKLVTMVQEELGLSKTKTGGISLNQEPWLQSFLQCTLYQCTV